MQAPPPRPRLVVLVGPKGSGKSTIGTMLAESAGAHFFRVEPVFLENIREGGATGDDLTRRGFQRVDAELRVRAALHPLIVIEATGAWPEFGAVLAGYRTMFNVALARIRAPLDVCRTRVRTRDTTVHIPVSDDRADAINAVAARVELDWDLDFDNGGPATREDILRAFTPLLR